VSALFALHVDIQHRDTEACLAGQGILGLFPDLEDNIAQHWNEAVLKKLRLAAPRAEHPLNILAVSTAHFQS